MRGLAALAWLIPYLMASERDQVLPEAMEIVKAIGQVWWWSKALASLIPYLMPPDADEILREALETAQAVEEHWAMFEELSALAPYLSPPLLADYLQAVGNLEDDVNWSRPGALAALAPQLTELPREQLFPLWKSTLNTLATRARNRFLVDLSPHPCCQSARRTRRAGRDQPRHPGRRALVAVMW